MNTNNDTDAGINELQKTFQTSELELKISGFFETNININQANKFETKLTHGISFNNFIAAISANINLKKPNQDIILNGYSIKNDKAVKKYLQQNCLILDENLCLFPELSLSDNLKLVSIMFSGFDLSQACLSTFSLKDSADIKVDNLSQNQKQMAILAYTVCCPAIIWIIKSTLLKDLSNKEKALFENTANIRIKHGGIIIIVSE